MDVTATFYFRFQITLHILRVIIVTVTTRIYYYHY